MKLKLLREIIEAYNENRLMTWYEKYISQFGNYPPHYSLGTLLRLFKDNGMTKPYNATSCILLLLKTQ